MSNLKMPVPFIGHASLMNIINDNKYTRSLRNLCRSLKRPDALYKIKDNPAGSPVIAEYIVKHNKLVNYNKFSDAGKFAVPTNYNYFSFIYSISLQEEKKRLSSFMKIFRTDQFLCDAS